MFDRKLRKNRLTPCSRSNQHCYGTRKELVAVAIKGRALIDGESKRSYEFS